MENLWLFVLAIWGTFPAYLLGMVVAFYVFTITKRSHSYVAVVSFATTLTLAIMVTKVTILPFIITALAGILFAIGSDNKKREVSSLVFCALMAVALVAQYYPLILSVLQVQ